MAGPTANERTQQVGMSRIVAASKLLVVYKLCLHEIKLFLRDDGGNLSHGFPLVRPGGWMTSMIVTNGSQSRLPMTCSGYTVATKKDRSGIDRIAQDATHGRLIPAQLPSGSRNFLTHQELGQPNQTLMFLLIALKHLSHHRCLGWLHPHACGVAWARGIDAISIGRQGRGAIRSPLDTSVDGLVACVRQSSCVHIRPPPRGFGPTTDHADCDSLVDQ